MFQSSKIGATVPKGWVAQFIDLLKEGNCYFIEGFMVAQNDISYKKTSHMFKLNFMRTTRVTNSSAHEIPNYYFDFSDFPVILAEQRQDLIVGNTSTLTNHKRNRVYMEYEI